MKNKIINNIDLVIIICFFVIGLLFRFIGISLNHSFWADEAYIGSISKNIVLNKSSIIDGFNLAPYQSMQVFSNIISFKIFGISEWSARFPSVIWGSIGIIFAYLLAKKFSDKYGGILSAFLYTIFQLNLAYSTQARPYVAIETIFLIVIFLLTKLLNDFKNVRLHITIIILSILATLYNYIGAITFIPYLLTIVFSTHIEKKDRKKYLILISILLAILFWILRIYQYFPILIKPQYNWITYIRDLFWRQYGIFSLSAIFGLLLIKDRKLAISISCSVFVLIYCWNFIQYSHNIRYLMPIFGLIIVLFGVFWSKVGKIIFKHSSTICILLILLIYFGGNKIIRKPSKYYSPNSDFSMDIQNADYKSFFQKAYDIFPNFDNLPIFIGPFDTLSWYTDRNPTAIFSIDVNKPVYNDAAKSWQYRSLKEFKIELAKYDKGLVIINDWQSLMPEEIKNFVKENMKLELRLESIQASPNDKWPLELYSWGMNKK